MDNTEIDVFLSVVKDYIYSKNYSGLLNITKQDFCDYVGDNEAAIIINDLRTKLESSRITCDEKYQVFKKEYELCHAISVMKG